MDQNNGLEAKISKEETRTILTMDFGEILPLLIRIFLQGQTSQMGITIRTMEDYMTNAQISHSIEAMEIDLEMDLSLIRMGIGETMGTSFVLHRFNGETFHKIVHTANQGVTSLTILLFADLTVAYDGFNALRTKISTKQ